jgi:hypothetical protein
VDRQGFSFVGNCKVCRGIAISLAGELVISQVYAFSARKPRSLREARFGEEVFNVHVISNMFHVTAIAGHEYHMVRPDVLLAKVRGKDLAAVQPAGNNVPSGSLRV